MKSNGPQLSHWGARRGLYPRETSPTRVFGRSTLITQSTLDFCYTWGELTFLICSFGRSGFTKWFPFFSIAYRQPSRNEVQINDKNSKLEKIGKKNIENFIKKI